jgi:farnesyl diphosphate synthase
MTAAARTPGAPSDGTAGFAAGNAPAAVPDDRRRPDAPDTPRAPAAPDDFLRWMRSIQDATERALAATLPDVQIAPARVHEAMRNSVLGGGKRVRPLLAHAAGARTRAPKDRVERVAVAIELIHAYSLVHDDLPCMDDDVLRRGRPTVHVQFDEATAMLAGDALQSEAFAVLAAAPLVDDVARNASLVKLFADACGSRGMAGGQAIDLGAVGRALSLPELEAMHAMKTGALIRAAILLGAACGAPLQAEAQRGLERYSECVGLAFQIVDDILDVEGSSDELGKTAGKDARQNKPTYVTLLGLDAAKRHAQRLHEEAIAAIAFGAERSRRLAQIAGFVILRRH